ncbi:hypothetical protein GF1_11760 [Desulfolithobacter dissulfuricans]|uniref:Uncharacterized protein n=1 Tax=Desulfolithobacter dissulfuricans TaxID=2795293 RepID=A0A915XI53_9BACT|nr:hypothetical protein [Desulfolithobacter dissulfuricans]BCO08800.1 hypothetical protein GF1_11760 [Desulfolithobacter dissulfuricans]
MKYSINFIPIKNLMETHQISRDIIIAEAIQGNLKLYAQWHGEWKCIPPKDLEYLPHPEEPFPQKKDVLGILKYRFTVSKGLHIKKEDLEKYLAANKEDNEKKEKLDSLGDVFDCIADGDLTKGEKKSLNNLRKKIPEALKFCILIMMEAAKVGENGQVEWEKYSRDKLEKMAVDRGLPGVIGRETHKQLPGEMKGK